MLCRQSRMLSQFLLDKCRDHGAIDLFGDVRVCADRVGQVPHFGDHLFNPLRCLDAVGVFFEARGLGDVLAAFGQEGDDLLVQAVDVAADFVEGGAGNGHVAEAP